MQLVVGKVSYKDVIGDIKNNQESRTRILHLIGHPWIQRLFPSIAYYKDFYQGC